MPKRSALTKSTVTKRTKSTGPKAYAGRVQRVPYSIASGQGAFPRMRECTLRYFETISVPIVSGQGNYTFSCNGLYDPNITGIGHQPMYFDQLMEVYNHYVVSAATITITPIYDGTVRSATHSLYIEDDVTGGLSTFAPERTGCRFHVVNTGRTSPQLGLTKKFSTPANFGPNNMSDPSLRGDSASNPTEGSYFRFDVNDPNLGSYGQVCTVFIEYKATFFELKTVNAS